MSKKRIKRRLGSFRNIKHYYEAISVFSDYLLEKISRRESIFTDDTEKYIVMCCNGFGFSIDDSKRFTDKYSDAFDNINELKKVIDEIDDVSMLGSAFFYKYMIILSLLENVGTFVKKEDQNWLCLILNRILTVANYGWFY